jgi:hypothetical protein
MADVTALRVALAHPGVFTRRCAEPLKLLRNDRARQPWRDICALASGAWMNELARPAGTRTPVLSKEVS